MNGRNHLKQFEEFSRNIPRSRTDKPHDKTSTEKNKRKERLTSNYPESFAYYLPHYATATPATFHLNIVRHVVQNQTALVSYLGRGRHQKFYKQCSSAAFYDVKVRRQPIQNDALVSKNSAIQPTC